MSKICPICKQIHDDDDVFCGYGCGVRLVPVQDNSNPALTIGDGTAVSGGVNINQSKNITSHDTHYHTTTVQERAKSDSELKLVATNQLRAKAEDIMAERGRIDSVAMGQLRPLALQLGIDDETFKSIIKEVRSNRNGSASGLSAANARYLQQAQQAVQTNDMDALSNLTPRLEAMAAISQDDNVQFMYYLTLSILYPIKSMEVYERQMDENYWRTFWAIISYIRTGKHAEANKVLALFDPLRYEKSEEDQNLLEAYFNIMKEDKDRAQEFLDEILGEPTEQVKPLLRAVESTLYEEEPESLEVRFYMERVMSKSDVVVKSQKKTETPAAKEEPKAPKPEKKAEPQPKAKDVPAPEIKKDNKEAEELYAKACATSGVKRVMLLQKAADAGSLEAMYDLADCYWDGEGVDKNIPTSVSLITKAADAGYTKAQVALGGNYYIGIEGIGQNYALAEKYLLMAANKENAEAQSAIAILYLEMEEFDKALVWARKAAQMEQPLAYLALGRIYDEGLGVEVNHIEGLKWFEKSAKGGNDDAQNTVGKIYLNADYVKHDNKKAFKNFQLAAAQGHIEAMAFLGYCYQEGIGTDINIQSAEEWLKKAADGGFADAQNALGNLYLEIIQDNHKAYKYYQMAAAQRHAYGMLNLGLCYLNGNGVKASFTTADEWIQKAADAGVPEAIDIINSKTPNAIEPVAPNAKEISNPIETNKKNKQEKKKESAKKTSKDKKKQIVVSKEIPDVKIDKIKKENKDSIYFSITYNNYIGRLLKCVFTYKPLHDGSIVSYERYFKIDKDILIELFEDEEYSTGLLCKGHFFWFEHIKFGDFTFNDYGDYYYKSNLTVYDDNNNLLSSYDFDLTIQYVHKIFGSDEIKIKEIH